MAGSAFAVYHGATMKLIAKKSLGQHFLNSTHVLSQIIETAQIKSGETILEIGPGSGILTEALLKSGANIVAIEKDSRAISLLKEKFANSISAGKLHLIEGDVLDTPTSLTSGPSTELQNGQFMIVANIPYYITGAILEKFLEHEPRPRRLILLVQREVAERIVAGEVTSHKESILSISVKAFGKPQIAARVPRGAFTPAPKVDSAILAIDDISESKFTENHVEVGSFFKILKSGFAHKRKYLIRNIEFLKDISILRDIWSKIGLDEKIRAENLSLDQWFQVSRSIIESDTKFLENTIPTI